MKRLGISLIEILIALALTTLIAGPLLFLYQSGLKSSTAGVVSIDLLSEGRRICAHLHDDLKNSCIPYYDSFSMRFSDLLEADFSRADGLSGVEYRLHRHAAVPELLKKKVDGKELLLRPVVYVRYRLERISGSELLKLVRIESADGAAERIKVLSERVGLLKIRPVKIKEGGEQGFLWNVRLQLAHVPENLETDRYLGVSDRSRGIMVNDFYDLVYSDFFKSLAQNPLAPRNWNTGLTFQRR